jgi:MFS transporter, OCT family, solute carrier family 22 (organic cation transporter), member 4/5
MNFDDVLPYLSRGDFGKYQKKIYVLLCLPSVLAAFHKLAGVFLLAVPDHRCKLDNELINASFELPENVWRTSFPFDESKNEFSKCQFFQNNSTVNCAEYIWNTTKVESSAVKSFLLICDRATWRASADSMMMVGVMIGSYVFGDLSDKYGRKPTFMLSLLIQVVFGLLTAVAPEFISYTICRMVRLR